MRKSTLSVISFNSIGEEPEEKKNPKKRLLYSLAKACGVLAAVNVVALLVFTGVGVGLGIGIKTIVPKLYGGTCSKNSDCTTISENGFICLNKTCQCSNSSYYSSYKCLTKKSYLSSCDSTILCNQNINLRCINSTCVCFNKMMWDGQSCVLKKDSGQVCVNNNECQDYLNPPLSCTNNTCSCPNTHYWVSSNCVPKKLYQEACSSNIECDDNKLLSCPTISNQCNCPTISVANKCDCSNGYFWYNVNQECTPYYYGNKLSNVQLINNAFFLQIQNSTCPGKRIEIIFDKINYDFTVNLQKGINDKIFSGAILGLHINQRFNARILVMNTYINGWVNEFRYTSPFSIGSSYKLIFTCNETNWIISINDKPYYTYYHVIPHAEIDYLCIGGDIDIAFIKTY